VTLQDVTLHIKPGQLVAVVGPVGAGKSSLISALLGEIPCVQGTRRLSGRVSLVAQEAWVQNKTVREGILFGRSYDRARFRAVIKAAQLKTDLEMLSAGAHTEIGERGVSLSGGQKARLSLARALYEAEADIFLLDDPLAAVDAHVTKALFDTAIAGVLHGKTRILVLSSNYHLLPAADLVVVMEDGRVLGAGTYQELLPRFPKYFDNGSGGGNGENPNKQKEDELERSLALSPVPGPVADPGRCAITLEELGKSARLDRMESVFPGEVRGVLMEKEVGVSWSCGWHACVLGLAILSALLAFVSTNYHN
jgi:ABC-type Mn2+/Zn2+ transport system ATPase subunit